MWDFTFATFALPNKIYADCYREFKFALTFQCYLKVFTFTADVLLFLFKLTELLFGNAELPFDGLLSRFHHPHAFSQDSYDLITLLQFLCTNNRKIPINTLQNTNREISKSQLL